MRRRVPRGAGLARSAWRTRLGFEKVRGGAWLSVFLTWFRRFVAWIERSEIRERRFGSAAAPGFRCAQPRLRNKKKKAERRQTLGNNRRILRCGARPFGARTLDGVPPRLSSRGVFHPQGQLQARLPGTRSERALPAFACPSPGMHLPPRSSCRGTDTQAAREQAANPPAGTALAPTTQCASAPCPSLERGLCGNWNRDDCQGTSLKKIQRHYGRHHSVCFTPRKRTLDGVTCTL